MNVHVIESADGIPKEKIKRAVETGEVIGLDIETHPKSVYLKKKIDVPPDPRLQDVVLSQVAFGEDVYVLRDNHASLRPLLTSNKLTKAIHNSVFERKHFLSHGIEINNVLDTMLIEGVLENGRQAVHLDLEDVCNRRLGIRLDKKVRDRFVRGDRIDDEMVKYAAEDAWVLPKLVNVYQNIGSAYYPGAERVIKMEHKLSRVVTQMELDGFGIDKEKWTVIADEVEGQLNKVRQELISALPLGVRRTNIFGDTEGTINLNSTDKVVDLMQKAGIDISDLKKETVTDLLGQRKYKGNRLLTLYQQYSLLEKASSTYGYGFLSWVNPVTGRVHPSLKQVGVRTGRFSGSQPNPMNVPKERKYRSCFMAALGHVLAAADYSQQELAILAEICRDPKMIEAFERGVDFHVHVARILFRDSSITDDDPRRKSAKNLNFGLIYGMGVKKLAKALGCSVSEAEELVRLHAREFPYAFEWSNDIMGFAKTNGYVATLLGRRRWLDLTENKYEREARNSPIQGTAADMTKLALILMHNRGLRPVNVVHDEIVVECEKELGMDVLKELQKCMVDAAGMLLHHVPIRADGYVNKRWVKPLKH